jgi:hypothetical protein
MQPHSETTPAQSKPKIEIKDEFRAARKGALLYSSLIFLLLWANPGEYVKFIGLDVTISTHDAVLALAAVSTFFILGFTAEYFRAIRSAPDSSARAQVASFLNTVEGASESLQGVTTLAKRTVDDYLKQIPVVTEKANQVPDKFEYDIVNPLDQLLISAQDKVRRGDDQAFTLLQELHDEINTEFNRIQQMFLDNTHHPEFREEVTKLKGISQELESLPENILREIHRVELLVIREAKVVRRISENIDRYDRLTFFGWEVAPTYGIYIIAEVCTLFSTSNANPYACLEAFVRLAHSPASQAMAAWI